MSVNENNNTQGGVPFVEEPIGKEQSGFEPQHDLNTIDTGDGTSKGSEGIFGMSHPSGGIEISEVLEIKTAPFTQADSAYLTKALENGFGISAINATLQDDTTGASTRSALMKYFTRRQPHPTLMIRGTNTLLPFGASVFCSSLTKTTKVGQLSAVEQKMESLIPSFSTPGSYREQANWSRIADLKNTVVNFYNRSIPFTDISAGDRFAIEICFTRDEAFAVLPIYAKKVACDMVKYWQDMGFQYDVATLEHLNSQDVEKLLKQIYSAVAQLPVLDDVMFKKLSKYAKLYTSAERSGFTPVLILQDINIGGAGQYQLSNESISGTSNQVMTVPPFDDAKALYLSSFLQLVEMFLRSDVYTQSDIEAVLRQALKCGKSIRTRYAPLLGCAQQLQNKKAINYHKVAEYLPVSGINALTLTYIIEEPKFSYSYKERFEYAPRVVAYENANGTAKTGEFRLCDLPADNVDGFDDDYHFYRPVGLYHGKDAWTTRELIDIGVFRTAAASPTTALIYPTAFIKSILNVTTTSVRFGDNPYSAVDAYYGDLYRANFGGMWLDGTTWKEVYSENELVSYYGMANGSENAPFATVAMYAAQGGSNTTPLSFVQGTQILAFTEIDFSDTNSLAQQAYQGIAALMEQVDLTLFLGSVKNSAGRICYPIVYFTGYRGDIWDRFDITPLDNAASNSYMSLTLQYTTKSQVKEEGSTRS